jgi:hypothetical protein
MTTKEEGADQRRSESVPTEVRGRADEGGCPLEYIQRIVAEVTASVSVSLTGSVHNEQAVLDCIKQFFIMDIHSPEFQKIVA